MIKSLKSTERVNHAVIKVSIKLSFKFFYSVMYCVMIYYSHCNIRVVLGG